VARVTLGRVARIGFTRGILGVSRPWLIIGAVATAARLVHRIGRAGPDTAFSEELHAGDRIEVRVLPPGER
jgi:hypothetical protein